jgi:hypothetical protein
MSGIGGAPGKKGVDSSRRQPWVWLGFLTMLAAALRLIGLNKGLWWDEVYFLTAEKLQAICRQGQDVWLVYTFPRYLDAAAQWK